MNCLARLKDTRITKKDILYLLLKVSVSIILCVGCGIIIGLILIVATDKVIDLACQRIYGVVPLNSSDKNLYYD